MFPNDQNLESEFTFETGATPIADDLPFHILVLGNWSGTNSATEFSLRRPTSIDRDNFDQVMQRLNVNLVLDLDGKGENPLSLTFSELDDFHPDNLFRNVPLFSDLRDLRRRLLNHDSFEQAAREVRSWFEVPHEEEVQETKPVNALSSEPADNLLDSILTGASTGAAPSKADKSRQTELGKLISQIVSPHLIRIDETEQTKLLAAVDQATSQLMRTILHHPQFQELEAAWRGLYFLARRVETDNELKIFILDVNKHEFTDKLKSVNNLKDSDFYRWLIRETVETPGGKPWAVVGGCFSFNLNVNDIASLMRFATLSAVAQAPFLSYIQPEMFGVQTFSEVSDLSGLKFIENSTETKLWSTLRELPESQYLGLAPMRLLARMPYGESTDSIESFSFEEFTDETGHDQYVWANPCFASLFLLAQSFRRYGWEFAQSFVRDIEGLPLHVFRQAGESVTKPCAEVVLTENVCQKLSEAGLMVLLSYRDSDRVRLFRLQSVANPPAMLRGKW